MTKDELFEKFADLKGSDEIVVALRFVAPDDSDSFTAGEESSPATDDSPSDDSDEDIDEEDDDDIDNEDGTMTRMMDIDDARVVDIERDGETVKEGVLLIDDTGYDDDDEDEDSDDEGETDED